MSTFWGHYALILSAVFNLLKNLAANVSSFGCSYIIILLSINHATQRKKYGKWFEHKGISYHV